MDMASKGQDSTWALPGMRCFCVWQAKELSLLTGAQVLLIVTSETGNMYEFATPKFNKVLETFKTWYRASAKDSKRIEVLLSILPLLSLLAWIPRAPKYAQISNR